jgi:hypothetical protein
MRLVLWGLIGLVLCLTLTCVPQKASARLQSAPATCRRALAAITP